MSEQERKTTLGDPMYVESLMTQSEWSERRRNYPSSSHLHYHEVNRLKTNSFKWRFGMGASLTLEEIKNTNGNLDYLLQKVENEGSI